MVSNVAIVGAGVSGLTSAIVLSENGYRVTVLTPENVPETTSAVAGAIWFPYETSAAREITEWSLLSFGRLPELSRQPSTGVSLVAFRCYSLYDTIDVPGWAASIGVRILDRTQIHGYLSGFEITVPLMENPKYLAYLQHRLGLLGGKLEVTERLQRARRCPFRFRCYRELRRRWRKRACA
jgi:D-amino-acid oxidase